MHTPSLKGVLFARDVEDVQKLLDEGRLSRDELRRWLEPEDLKFLEQPVLSSSWYPIGTAARMLQLLQDVEGGGSVNFLLERGASNARQIYEAGLYQQLEYLNRTQATRHSDASARFAAYGRDLRLLNTLSASLFNFATWTSRVDPEADDRYVIEVIDAAELPDLHCWCAQGFMNWMAEHSGAGATWSWRRPAPDLVVFYMPRPFLKGVSRTQQEG